MHLNREATPAVFMGTAIVVVLGVCASAEYRRGGEILSEERDVYYSEPIDQPQVPVVEVDDHADYGYHRYQNETHGFHRYHYD